MYLDYYNLTAEPFQITPDPEFLYLSPSHREALATITYAVEQGKGFMALVGEVGLGKTTLLQAFLQERQGGKEKLIYLFNSRLSYPGLLRVLARELELEAASEEPEALLDHIYRALIREYEKGNSVVLLIDEAQGLPEETLEGLRLISNLETPTEKLLQIVLVGQPELAAKLDRYELRQLKQRIAVQATLSPLTRAESREYLRFRLEKAGGRVEDIFTPRALEKIVRRAKGIPRSLNILADNALVTGFGYQRKPIPLKVVKEVITDLEGRKRPFSRRWALPSLAALLIALGALGASIFNKSLTSGPRVSVTLNGASRSPQDTLKDPSEKKALPSAELKPAMERKAIKSMAQEIPAPGKTETSRVKESLTLGGREKEPVATVESPASEKETLSPRENQERFPVTKIVREGDSLYRLTREIYNSTNPELWELVRKHNPRIKEDLKIRVGEKIIFPEWKKMAKNGE